MNEEKGKKNKYEFHTFIVFEQKIKQTVLSCLSQRKHNIITKSFVMAKVIHSLFLFFSFAQLYVLFARHNMLESPFQVFFFHNIKLSFSVFAFEGERIDFSFPQFHFCPFADKRIEKATHQASKQKRKKYRQWKRVYVDGRKAFMFTSNVFPIEHGG